MKYLLFIGGWLLYMILYIICWVVKMIWKFEWYGFEKYGEDFKGFVFDLRQKRYSNRPTKDD